MARRKMSVIVEKWIATAVAAARKDQVSAPPLPARGGASKASLASAAPATAGATLCKQSRYFWFHTVILLSNTVCLRKMRRYFRKNGLLFRNCTLNESRRLAIHRIPDSPLQMT
jgi:hypothetical protein